MQKSRPKDVALPDLVSFYISGVDGERKGTLEEPQATRAWSLVERERKYRN